MFFGLANFYLLNSAVTMAPLALVMVIWQMNPFWITIIAYFLLSEQIILIELIGIFISFGAVVMIALRTKYKTADDNSEVELMIEDD